MLKILNFNYLIKMFYRNNITKFLNIFKIKYNMSMFDKRNIKRNTEVKLNGIHGLKPLMIPSVLKNTIFSILFMYEKLKYKMTGKIEIPQVEFVLTTKCTLKCRDCVNYIPLIKNHIKLDLEDFKNDLNSLLSITSKINNLILIGGEPLLVKNLEDYLEYAAKMKKIKNIYIVSNGTIVPNKNLLEVLRKYRKKTNYWLSDYSKNTALKLILHKEEVINALKQYKINLIYNESLRWESCTPPKKNNRTKQQNTEYYKKCIHPCLSIIDGKLNQCPRSSTYLVLGMIDNSIQEYLDLRSNPSKNMLKDFYSKDNYESCDFCNFHEDFFLPKVIPAIQSNIYK